MVVGDSYALGAADDPGNIPAGYPTASKTNPYLWAVTSTPSFTPMREPTGVYPEAGLGLSPGGAFAWRRWQETGKGQILVNAARGAQRSDQWRDDNGGILTTAKSMQRYAMQHGAVTFGGIIIVQGANNAIQAEEVPGQDYQADWNLVDAALDALPGASGAPRLVGILQTSTTPQATQVAWDDVITQQEAFVAEDPDREPFVLPDGPMTSNGLHHESLANLEYAERALDALP